MAAEFGWPHNFWRMPPRGPGIGWRELQAWIDALNTRRQGRATDPDTWDGRNADPWWAEQDRKRADARGF